VTKTVHQLKVTLRDVRPPVWRRIVVRSETRLDELAAVLEAAMGWEGYHLHQYWVGRTTRYCMPDPDWGTEGDRDERRFRLGEVLPAAGKRMTWEYDFGDGWEHDVVAEAIDPADPGVDYPVCIKGRRACPPEDCGGPWGYGNLLEALADPDHPNHDDLTEWAPIDFDPARFDVDETTEAMRSLRPLAGW